MNTAHQDVRQYVALVAKHSPLAPRLRKLVGNDAVADVIDRATLRVCGEQVPYFIRSAPDLWSFFDERPSDVRTMLLCHRALDAARKSFIQETSVSGGAPLDPKTLKIDIEAQENLARFTEAGQAFAMEPARELEQGAQLEAEAAALESRKQLAADEFATLRQNLAAYGLTLPRKWRTALRMVSNEPKSKLPNGVVAARCGVAAATVTRIRDHFELLSARFFSLMASPEEGANPAVPESIPTIAESDLISQIADAPDLLTFAEALHAPELEIGEASEALLHSYARRDSSRKGRRMYSDVELVTGNRYRGWEDPAQQAERDQYANRKFSATELQMLERKSAEAGFDLSKVLRAIDTFLTRRALDSLLTATIAPKKRRT